jgi:tetratricopeptide (TPR) repeat protein
MRLDLDSVAVSLSNPKAGDIPLAPLTAEQKRVLAEARAGRASRGKGDIVNRALAAVDAEDYVEAARLGMAAVKQYPDCMPAHLASAVALDRLGYLVDSLEFFAQAVQLSPENPTICGLLGGAAERANQLDLAAKFYRKAIELDPGDAGHVSDLAGVLRALGRFGEAIEVLRNQIYVTPENANLWNTLGTVLQEQGEPEQALTFFAEAVRLKPKFARAYHNLGSTLTDLGRFAESGAALDQAIAGTNSPGDRAEMRHARSLARLGEGRMIEGWDDYEARFDPLTVDPMLFQAPRPRWRGEDLAGKRLMILGEQGLGDEVIFLNAAADAVAAAGPEGKVTIACQKRLVPLIARSFPQARAIAHYSGVHLRRNVRLVRPESEWDEIDFWTPMGDVTKAFRRAISDFPAVRGYLRPDPARVAALKAQLSAAPGLKIGILWKSLVMTPKRMRYFAPFEPWAAVLKAANVTTYTLQYGDTAEEEIYARDTLGVEMKRIDGLDLKDDLDGVAAAGQALDLIIGPMNATTNIAAAAGADVWFVHRYGSWTMHGTESTPYYPHTRAWCAPEGDWRALFGAMARDLEARAARENAA